ncbi:hypothetical protein PYW08_007730 [Mythimna loreyi]|uniref:Uncharacterized protein n=1 Tax=Mythimna loreyi TaxID=667449 RepID=A0ACC2QD08_9NEOP|nr:hypothetical protein PYW08_007730 [Mythimna loreyi]
MYSNMCVKIALCLALIVSIDGYVLKHRALPLPAEGMTVEITVKRKEDPRHPLSTMKIDINEQGKKVEMSMSEAPSGVLEHLSKANNDVRNLEDRVLNVGTCPVGKVFYNNFCIPNEELEDYSQTDLSKENHVPTLESRATTTGVLCPAEYTPQGRYCIPKDYS